MVSEPLDTSGVAENITRLEQEKTATEKILKGVVSEPDREKFESLDVMFGGKGEFQAGIEKEIASKEAQIEALKGMQTSQREIARAEAMAEQPDVIIDRGQLDEAKQIFIEEKKKRAKNYWAHHGLH